VSRTPVRDTIDAGASLADIAALLDGLDHDARVAATRELDTAQQRRLYELASSDHDLELSDMVDRPLRVVTHAGWNTLPLPAVGRRFAKEMVRQPDGRIAGYNRAPLGWAIGPGYFVLRQTIGDEQRHAPIVVDYFQTPKGELPAEWPRVLPNWFGPQALIYGWCRDYLRRVSDHVTIGAAFKLGRPGGSYFVLVRDPIVGD